MKAFLILLCSLLTLSVQAQKIKPLRTLLKTPFEQYQEIALTLHFNLKKASAANGRLVVPIVKEGRPRYLVTDLRGMEVLVPEAAGKTTDYVKELGKIEQYSIFIRGNYTNIIQDLLLFDTITHSFLDMATVYPFVANSYYFMLLHENEQYIYYINAINDTTFYQGRYNKISKSDKQNVFASAKIGRAELEHFYTYYNQETGEYSERRVQVLNADRVIFRFGNLMYSLEVEGNNITDLADGTGYGNICHDPLEESKIPLYRIGDKGYYYANRSDTTFKYLNSEGNEYSYTYKRYGFYETDGTVAGTHVVYAVNVREHTSNFGVELVPYVNTIHSPAYYKGNIYFMASTSTIEDYEFAFSILSISRQGDSTQVSKLSNDFAYNFSYDVSDYIGNYHLSITDAAIYVQSYAYNNYVGQDINVLASVSGKQDVEKPKIIFDGYYNPISSKMHYGMQGTLRVLNNKVYFHDVFIPAEGESYQLTALMELDPATDTVRIADIIFQKDFTDTLETAYKANKSAEASIGTGDELYFLNNKLIYRKLDTYYVIDYSDTSTSSVQPIVQQNRSYSIYPNPATNRLFLSGDINKIEKVAVYNLLGTRVKQLTNVAQWLDISDLPAGYYQVLLYLQSGGIQALKFVKSD